MCRSRRLKRRHFLELGLQGGLLFLAAGPIGNRSRKRALPEAADPRLQRILEKYGGEFGRTIDPAGEEIHVCV